VHVDAHVEHAHGAALPAAEHGDAALSQGTQLSPLLLM
jgi:hypothetical protein